MSAKNRDDHGRFRNITVGFRVSPQENEQINVAVALSGLPKQEYCYRKCMNRDIMVQGNPRVYKALRNQLAAVLEELKRIEAAGELRDELLDNIEFITRTLYGMAGGAVYGEIYCFVCRWGIFRGLSVHCPWSSQA